MKMILVAGARPNFMKIAPILSAIKEHNSKIEECSEKRDNLSLKDGVLEKLETGNRQLAPTKEYFQQRGVIERLEPIEHILLHTDQHYDNDMSDIFFEHLSLLKPDIHLKVGSASHAVQTAEIMKRFERSLLNERPDVVVVVGDVNSTIACALVASKIDYRDSGCKMQDSGYTMIDQKKQKSRLWPLNSGLSGQRPLIAHVEAGLRSFDRTMPEEINRILTDQLSDFLFTTEESANQNLRKEGIPEEKIFFVGNTMIDTLLTHHKRAQKSKILQKLGLVNSSHNSSNPPNSIKRYAVLTLHRPSNVDDKKTFKSILEALFHISSRIPIILPTHPRTLNRIKEFNFGRYFEGFPPDNCQPAIGNCGIHCVKPLGYLDFLCLMSHATLVLTDSGGIQEETTILGIPCITLRENTERPVTITEGTNVIVGSDGKKIIKESYKVLEGNYKRGNTPKLWDGKAAKRIVDIISSNLKSSANHRFTP